MTPSEFAYFDLCYAVARAGFILYTERLGMVFEAFNTLVPQPIAPAVRPRSRAHLRVVK